MSASRGPAINLARRPFRNNTVHYVVFISCFVLLVAASVYNVYDYASTGGEISRLDEELGDRTGRYRGLGDEVEKDERVRSCNARLTFIRAASKLSIELSISDDVGPFRLVLSISADAVEILELR